MAWNNPIALPRVLQLLELVELAPGDPVLDLGCGSGELLAALHGVRATGVDLDKGLISEARRAWPELHWIQGEASSHRPSEAPRLAICMGSTHAFGQGEAALSGACAHLRSMLETGGWALIGEGFQRRALPEPYAALPGTPSGIERTHLQNVRAIEAAGFEVQAAMTATDAEWEAFEWAFYRRRGNTRWRDAWLEHGHSTMGFAAYLAKAR